MGRFTEGEITSLTRQFFRANNFSFLARLPKSEKFYYRIDENLLNNKQPDSVFLKQDLVVLCEDKVNYNDLFEDHGEKVSDYKKLTSFLKSEANKTAFVKNVLDQTGLDQVYLVGCLSSLRPIKEDVPSVTSENLINLQISTANHKIYKVEIHCDKELDKYFTAKTLELSL